MTQRHHIALALSVVLIASCGGQVGEEQASCQAVQTEPLELNELSPLGFSAMDVLNTVAGVHISPLRWADGTNTELTTVFSFTGSAAFHVRDWVDDGGARELAIDGLDCPDIVELAMSVSLTTADGALSETWDIALQAPTSTSSNFARDLEALMGTLSIDSFKPAGDFDSNRAFLDLRVTDLGVSGSIVGQVTSGDADVVSARSYEIAEFDPASP